MNEALKRAIDEIEKLDDQEQSELAGILLAEIEDETKWAKKFAQQPKLNSLVENARRRVAKGETTPLDFHKS